MTDTAADASDEVAEPTLEDLLSAVDAARDRVRHADEAAQQVANSLQDATDAFTKAALVTLVRALRADERGRHLLVEAARQPDVAALFTLHGIIRGGREREVLAVLEAMKPHLTRAGAGATLDKLDGDVIVLKFSGVAAGHGASARRAPGRGADDWATRRTRRGHGELAPVHDADAGAGEE